jgi:hypothetical protein
MVNQFSGVKGDPQNWINGQSVLEHYGLKHYVDNGGQRSSRYTWYTQNVNMWANFGFMCIFFLGFFGLAWIMLRSKKLTIRTPGDGACTGFLTCAHTPSNAAPATAG